MRTRPCADHRNSSALIGHSAETVRLRAEVDRVARFSSNVLVTGPSGTGKEARRAANSRTQSAPSNRSFRWIARSMSGELMSSQLFGHVAGAFTGANCDALGCFRAAHRGTIFLDEIGELDYPLQAKLLRVLQEHEVTPVGSHQGERVDVRVIAATNRNLRMDVLEGRFREDLYYRLDVVHLRTTALASGQTTSAIWQTRFSNSSPRKAFPPAPFRASRSLCSRHSTGRATCVSFATCWSRR